MTDLEIITHKPSKWALAGIPLYLLGAFMLAMPTFAPAHSAGEWALLVLVMTIGMLILLGALFAFAGHQGIVVRGEGRRIVRWWRLFGLGRRHETRVRGDESVIVRKHRARGDHPWVYLVLIATEQRGFNVETFREVEKARELAGEIATRLELSVRDETTA